MSALRAPQELFVATVAVFFLPDAGHRCLVSDSQEAPAYAGACASSEDSLGWTARGTPASATNAEGCTLDPNGERWKGQQVYIDEGVGVGAVVGSTMFNTLCIIGGSAVVSGKISKLDWRIIMRDGTSYMVAIFSLAIILNFGEQDEPVRTRRLPTAPIVDATCCPSRTPS
jgi:hypothetical protein